MIFTGFGLGHEYVSTHRLNPLQVSVDVVAGHIEHHVTWLESVNHGVQAGLEIGEPAIDTGTREPRERGLVPDLPAKQLAVESACRSAIESRDINMHNRPSFHSIFSCSPGIRTHVLYDCNI